MINNSCQLLSVKASAKALFVGVVTIALAFIAGSPVQAQTSSWDGLTITGGLGAAFSDVDYSDPTAPSHFFVAGVNYNVDTDGFATAAQVGLQRQFGAFVAGVQAGVMQLGDGRNTGPASSATALVHTAEISPVYTAAALVGYPMGNWMPYVKGGYATAEVSTAVVLEVGFPTHVGDSEKFHHGFIIGGGVQIALGEYILVGAEYNYINLGNETHRSTDSVGLPYVLRVKPDDIHAIMGTVTLKFDFFN